MSDATSNSTTNTGNTAGSVPTLKVNVQATGGNHSIRNIMQTVQEREIIKTAPDIIIYLNGKTYLVNPYVEDTKTNPSHPSSYTYVSFNDHVQSFQATYDVDNLGPTANFSLAVPNHQKYLYQSPGGNNLIESMMEVQVFAKGYFASASGNTIYYRVFKGLTTNVNHQDNGMVLQISIQCLGILHFLALMYTDLAPASLTNSDSSVVPYQTNQYGMNPYQMLGDVFTRPISTDQFTITSIQQAQLNKQGQEGDDWAGAVEAGYINKWQPILDNLRREVHITGYLMGKDGPSDKDQPVPDSADNNSTRLNPESQGSSDPSYIPARFSVSPKVSLVEQATNSDFYVSLIRNYQMDTAIGSLQLTNGRITNRLERIRTILQSIGYEGFQDVDGTIIFKPPLYNLDVTNVTDSTNTSKNPTYLNLRTDSNPFVVHLSEIETESETEDEQGIRATRVTVQTPIITNGMISPESTRQVLPTITHIDIPKLAKFGVREEPARPIPWLSYGSKIALYTYAVCELVRANRSWKTYTLTIPLRPELKLGFPMYLPHKDMYGYIKNISIQYQYGNAATMSITLDSLRKRPMFPATHPVGSSTGTTQDKVIYTTQPNLVMQWTEPPSSANTTTTNPTTATGQSQATNATNKKASTASGSGGVSSNSKAKLVNSPATQRQSPNKPVYQEDWEVISNRRNQWGTSWQTKADTTTKSFRVQNDKTTIQADGKFTNCSGAPVPIGQPFFSKSNWLVPAQDEAVTQTTSNGQQPPTNKTPSTGINIWYMQKILTAQPYTDEGGYELLTPFPWGRWKSLNEALLETRLGILTTTAVNSLETQSITGANVFLFAGVGSPSAIDPSASLASEMSKLSTLSSFEQSATSFELVTPPPGTPQNGTKDTQPDNDIADSLDDVANRIDFFVSGGPPPPSNLTPLYRPVTPPTNNTQIPNALGVTPSSDQQAQTFVSKLLNGNKSTT